MLETGVSENIDAEAEAEAKVHGGLKTDAETTEKADTEMTAHTDDQSQTNGGTATEEVCLVKQLEEDC